MTTRYFKADDGERIYFRATKTKAYTGLKPDRYNHRAWTSGVGQWPAVEITKAEYDRLVILKGERVNRTWKGPNMPRW